MSGDTPSSQPRRVLVTVDTRVGDLAGAALKLSANEVEIIQRLDLIDILVVAGPLAKVRQAASDIREIRSVEEERSVTTG